MINRIALAHLPTPIEPMPNLSDLLHGPQLFVKRDDQTGLAFGGNKTRKLEFLVADALDHGAKILISAGAIQSNHCRQVAAAAAKMGLKCKLVLFGEKPDTLEGNFLLYHLFDAEAILTNREQRDTTLQKIYEDSFANGEKPYLIPYGGSNPIGAVAYAYAFDEMLSQNFLPDWIVFASSSGGTQAGLVLGAKRANYDGKVLGISVDGSADALKALVTPLATETSLLLGAKVKFSPEEILVNADYIGEGYAIMGVTERKAILLFARLEGLLLDPVYTGKAAAGMIDLIHKGFFKSTDKVLFWHTGGSPVLFPHQYSQTLID